MSQDDVSRQFSGTMRLQAVWSAFLALSVFAMLGCSELTSVNTVDVAQASDFENRTGARTLRAGAIARFTHTYAGGALFQYSQAVLSARISDEFTATHDIDEYDRREIPEISTLATGGGFRDLSQTRINVLQAIGAMQRFDPSSQDDIAELFALLAYTELFFGENFCSGVPLSSLVEGQPAYGAQLTTVQMLERAVADFDSAVTYAGNGTRALHLAQVGRARALLQLGRYSDAAAAVAGVPTGFLYQTTHAPNTQENGIWWLVTNLRRVTVADREGGNGLDFVTADDPRVRTQLLPVPGTDGRTPVHAPEKYASAMAPVVLASGIEARLIEAEALLHAGDASSALGILNGLRATMPELEPLPLEPSDVARVDQLFRERAFWLFLTGHRHGDLRRLVRQYGRNAGDVFPRGAYRDGLAYGNDVTLGLHVLEGNNPNFIGGCFDRNP